MNCILRNPRPLAGLLLIAALVACAACGDDFPVYSDDDVAVLDDVAVDVGTLDTTEGGDVASLDGGSDAEKIDTDTPDAGTPDAGTLDAGDGAGDAADGGGDATPACPGAAGCACEEDKDCKTGGCLLGNDGKKVCAAPCAGDTDCAGADACQDVSGVKLCVPAGAALCAPCVSNNACQYGDNEGVCVAGGSEGNFCGTGCKETADCGAGYSCEDVKDVDGKDAKQCVPDNKGTCSCSGYAIAIAAKTTCFAAGLPGCTSTRTCLADGAAGAPAGGGLGVCTTKAPEAETCDGLDNDCDGDTDESGAKGCDDNNPCTTDSCEGGNGCAHKKLDGTTCDDGDACTKGDTCAVGLCAGATVSCDDNNPCTDDACDMAVGCTASNNSSSCDDANACTKDDTCAVGLCAGATVVCDDSDPCTDDSCDLATGCTTTNNTDKCDDGDACTKDDACAASLCAGVTLDCDDGNSCTTDSCDAKLGCQNAKLMTGACDDGSACTTDDTCDAGACKGKALDCDDNNPCTEDACDLTSGCTSTDSSKACDDGSACTEGDACSGGKCEGTKKSCEDGNACTDDSCDPTKGCVFADNASPCDDSDPCSVKDTCAAGKCAGSPKNCDDSNACTADSCDKTSGNCLFKALVSKVCSDGNACTDKDACDKDGKCAGAKVNCEDGKACTDDPCDPKTGCAAKILTKKPCDDDSVCTTSDTCDGKGKCVGTPVVCDDNNPCTNDSCDAKTGCQHKNNTAKCDDGDTCTTNDVCSAGKCKPGVNSCQCKTDKDCEGSGGNLCNGALVCKSNKCVVSAANVVKCKDDNNSCTIDACSPKTGKCPYTPVKDGTGCDADGTKCTAGDSCQQGKCVAGKKLDCDDSKPCTADSCDKNSGCVNQVLKTGGVTSLNFNAYPGADGVLGTKDDKPAAKDDGVSTQYSSYGLTFGLVGGGVPRIHISNSLAQPHAPNVLRPVDPKLPVTAANYKDFWVKLDKPAMRVKIMVLDVHTGEASALKAYNGKGVLIASAKHPGGANGLKIPLEVKVDGSKGWISRIVVDLTNGSTSATGPELYDDFEFEWVPGCSDGNICTEPDTCDRIKGVCLAGGVKSCDDGNQCTKDSCDATLGCKNAPLDKVPCEDGNKCTDGDACAKGSCIPGKKKGCDDGKPCTADSCDPKKGCVYTALKDGDACSDNNACTTPDACKAAKCVPGAALKCDDGDLCTLDSCDPKTGCKTTPIAGCGVKPMSLPYFEPFGCGSTSAKLWKLTGSQTSPAWAIDATPATPAAYSPKCSLNFNDGTNYACKGLSKSLLGYATSPKIDLGKAKLPTLTFQLGGDWEANSYDDVQLQVSSNGVSFTTLANYDDAGSNKWAKKTVSLAAYVGKTVTLRFRFYTADCYSNSTSGAFVDDVKVEDAACKSNAACSDGNNCTVDVCTLKTGKCVHTSVKNGVKCEDGNLCTVDTCQKGSCMAGPTLKCKDDGNACTAPAVCLPKTGKCESTYVETCNDANPCTVDACNTKTGGCTHQTLKTCKPKCKTASDCFDSNPCSNDVCGKDGFCEWTSVATPTVCGDGKICGKGTQCVDVAVGWARNISGNAYGYHYCATTAAGGVACWGRNNYYQSGNPKTTVNQTKPHVVAGLKGIKSVTAGRYHTCALSSIGEVWCWGRNNYGQAAPGLKATVIGTPQKIGGLLAVRKLALGYDFTCAHHADRTVSCWGYNLFGQLGHGNTSSQLGVKKVAGLTGVLDIAADYFHACVIRSDRGLYCTGNNTDRQTSELSGNRSVFTKRNDATIPDLRYVMAGFYTTCGGTDGGWGCVGNSTYGAMGNGSTADAIKPAIVDAGKQTLADMAGGYYAHYALAKNGDVYGAGRDSYGNFGLAATATSRTKFVKAGFVKSADVDGTYNVGCVLTLQGMVYCAGYNFYGNLGNGTTTSSSKPVLVSAPCTSAKTCGDGDPCTADTCSAGSCKYAPLSSGLCDDGNACTVKDTCSAGKCVGKPAACDDKNACTVGDACVLDKAGLASCVPGVETKCDDKDKCTADSCDKATGKCVFKAIPGCQQACKQDVDCDDQNPCTENKCLAGGCLKKSVNEGMLCDEAKICSAGQCASSGKGWAAKITAQPYGSHTCALGTDAKVYCWGDNGSYRAGQPAGSSVTTPKAVPGIVGATDVVAGYDHTCAKVAGKWLCWGDNTYGQLGNGASTSDTAKALAVTVAADIAKLTAGYRHTCALSSKGTVTCWGYGYLGRLGYGSSSSTAQPKGVAVKGLTNAVDLWTGDAHSCATVKTGEVYCWGSNYDRRIADVSTTAFYAPVKKVGAGFGVAGGYAGTCWPSQGGTGWCTGDNDNGQLGNGQLTDSGKPVQVVGPKGIVHVAGGGDHTTVVTGAGKLWVAGDNDNGQLGIGSTVDSKKFVPVTIPGDKAVIQVKSGYNHTCVLLVDGAVLCSGDGSYGIQGDGSSSDDTTFSAAAGPCTNSKQCNDNNPCTDDACKAGTCTYVANKAPCSDGKGCTSGDGCSGGACVGKPVTCDDKNACTVGDHCVEGSGGLAKCVVGKLKVCNDNKACTADSCDTKTGACKFTAIPGCVAGCKTSADCDDGNPCTDNACLANKCIKKNVNDGMVCAAASVCGGGVCAGTGKGWAAKISGHDGGEHFCALGTDGKAYCWGEGGYGRLGDGSTSDNLKPTLVAGLSNLADVIACDTHSCALGKDGKAYCWGRNSYGQLGNGSTTSSSVTKPVAVTVSATFKQLTCGENYTCGILPNDSVTCWGYGSNGRLGSGSSSSASHPKGIAVKGMTSVAKIEGFDDHACAIKMDGTVWCWGENYDKPLQNTSTTRYYAPVQKVDAKGASFIQGAVDNVCWGKGGKGYCAGDNDNGQLGNKPTTDSGVGVLVSGPAGVSSMAGGWNFNTAVAGDGSLWGVGDNGDGQLGLGNKADVHVWSKVALGTVKVVQSAAVSYTQCVLTAAGTVLCSGDAYSGRLGTGSSSTTDATTFAMAAGPCVAASQCNDGNPCTIDACKAGSCTYAPNSGKKIACNDGLGCTMNDVCTAGKCAGTPVSCDDKNGCTVGDACVEGKLGAPVCVPGEAKACDDLNPCTTDSCSKITGGCVFKAIPACTIGCKSHADCNDSNPCTQDSCSTKTGMCTQKPINAGQVCGSGARCSAGKCATITTGWAKAISADSAGNHVCALRHDNTVACWGRNYDGEIGTGTKSQAVRKPVVVGGLSNVMQVAAGVDFTCALRTDGKLYCWGANSYGQCGNGVASSTDLVKPTLASKVPALSAVWAGYYRACGRTQTGDIVCWGYNYGGDLGDGTTTPRYEPVKVLGLPKAPIVKVTVDYRRSCALTSAGDLYCWGYNFTRDVNPAPTSAISKATKHPTVSGVAVVGGGAGTCCAMQPAKQRVVCWGDGADGELGYGGKPTMSGTPLVAKGLTAQPVIMSGGDDHTLMVTTAGDIYGAGDGYYYQLGLSSSSDVVTLTQSGFKPKVVDVVGANNTTCALGFDGEVYCVGYNYYGTVGSSSTSSTVKTVSKVIKP